MPKFTMEALRKCLADELELMRKCYPAAVKNERCFEGGYMRALSNILFRLPPPKDYSLPA